MVLSIKRDVAFGVLLVSPEGKHSPLSVKLNFDVTNNAAEYEACILGLKAAISLDNKKLRVYGDSSLIINQISKLWKVRNESLLRYQAYLETRAEHIPEMPLVIERRQEPTYIHIIDTEPDDIPSEPWFTGILNYLTKQEYPPGAST